MAKYNVYAVAYGINPQSKEPVFNLKFRTWDQCKPYVVGVEGAKYKGFLTDDEADAWLDKKVAEIFGNKPEGVEDTNTKQCTKSWQEKADDIYQAKLHPVDEAFLLTCQRLGLSKMDTEHLLKKMFVDVVNYLDDHGCISELPFK